MRRHRRPRTSLRWSGALILTFGLLSSPATVQARGAEDASAAHVESKNVPAPVTERFADPARRFTPDEPRPDREYWLKQTNVAEGRPPDGPGVP